MTAYLRAEIGIFASRAAILHMAMDCYWFAVGGYGHGINVSAEALCGAMWSRGHRPYATLKFFQKDYTS